MSDAQAHVLTGLSIAVIALLILGLVLWPVVWFGCFVGLAALAFLATLWGWFFEAHKGRS